MTLRCFFSDVRAGATGIAAAVVTLMSVAGAALITDHAWLVDQRDVLKAATDAGGIAATLEMARILNQQPNIKDDALKTALEKVARRYVELNLGHLPKDRYTKATNTLVVKVVPHRAQGTVDVTAQADLGGTILSQSLPIFGSSDAPQEVHVEAQVKSFTNPVEVVLAVDVSKSMERVLDGRRVCQNMRCPYPENRGPDSVRITIVKRGAADLVDILNPSRENRVAMGVVPWHGMVRLDSDASTDWEDSGWAEYPTRRVYGQPYVGCAPGVLSCTPPASVTQALAPTAPETWKGCLDSHRTGSVGTSASLPETTSELFTAPSNNAFAQAFFPAVLGAAYECRQPPLPSDFGWTTCYHGRKYTRSTSDAAPDEAQHNCPADNPTILSLSTNADTISEAINALTPVGTSTYSALGVLWSQRLLEHSWKGVWDDAVHPVDPAARDNQGLRKAIVLLTDGEDTYCGKHKDCAGSRLGHSLSGACAKVKAKGTEIFVIAAMHPNLVSGALGDSLRECSSESDDSDVTYAFLNNSTPEKLRAVFAEIANQLRVVRRVY